MDVFRRVEKRTRLLEQLRNDYLVFGVQDPVLPDCGWPKRRFEKAAFEAREVLRQLKDKEKVLLVDLGDPDRTCWSAL